MKPVRILALETSCDETSVAVIGEGPQVLANIISTQIEVHQKFGGVVPEIASRKHVELINGVIAQALDEAKITFQDVSAIAVTSGPGLVGALLVGVSAAKALAFALGLPLISVHHLEAHISANFLVHQEVAFPALCLVVSGGHTELLHMEGIGQYRLLGRTRDDAVGEAFDKVARAMELGYPGGPLIDKLAKEGNPEAIQLPRVRLEPGSLDFSFSGLKSAVLNYLNKAKQQGQAINQADLAASFQRAVTDVLVDKTWQAASGQGVKTILLAGGVAANGELRQRLAELATEKQIKVLYPPPILCTDNAAMVGCAAYYKYLQGSFSDLHLNARPNLPLY